MALTSRLALTGSAESDPEDFMAAALDVIFPDDVTNQHGDADHGLLYSSPHLSHPLSISLSDPHDDEDRRLFSHYLWNSSLLLAELIEAGTLAPLGPDGDADEANGGAKRRGCAEPISPPITTFNVAGLSTIELGAGTALPSLLAALLGAERVAITDYPSPVVLENLMANVQRNVQPSFSPLPPGAALLSAADVLVWGHEWGELTEPLALANHHAFDRVLVADCLWMPWQHGNLHRSIEWFLGEGPEARVWVVAALHTGREKMRGFFGADALAAVKLEVEAIWERECDGTERAWTADRGVEDVTIRKRWLVAAVLRRKPAGRPEEAGQ